MNVTSYTPINRFKKNHMKARIVASLLAHNFFLIYIPFFDEILLGIFVSVIYCLLYWILTCIEIQLLIIFTAFKIFCKIFKIMRSYFHSLLVEVVNFHFPYLHRRFGV